MPRQTGSERTRAFNKRTRSGCSTCRARKVKCDERRPKCAKCTSRGEKCEYDRVELKWEAEYHLTGRAFGREGVWTKDGPHARVRQSSTSLPCSRNADDADNHHALVSMHHFIHTRFQDVRLDVYDDMYLAPLDDTAPSFSSQAISSTSLEAARLHRSFLPSDSTSILLRSPSPYQFPGVNEAALLEYYLLRVCKLANASRHPASPFLSLIMPFLESGSHDLATLAAMAFTARHRSLSHPRWSAMALSFKGRALAALRQTIGTAEGGTTTRVLQSPQIPVSMMFLCLYEIIDNCDNAWVLHLRASQDFLMRRKQLCPPAEDETEAERSQVLLAENFFAFQDAISRTACGNSSVFGLEYWQSADRQRDDVGWLGQSTKLTEILFKTTELGRLKDGIQEDEFSAQASALEEELGALKCDANNHDDFLMRESAMLYQQCLLRDATPSTPEVSEAVDRILQSLVKSIQGTDQYSTALAFPLFIAAVELDPLTEDAILFDSTTGPPVSRRRLVLDILHSIADACFFNNSRVGDVIRQVWAHRDLHPERRGELQSSFEAVNDWNFYVSPYCRNLSLA